MGYYTQLASAIYNDLHAGLKGMSNEWTLSIEQLEDTISDFRIKLLSDKLKQDERLAKMFSTALTCIPVDCKPIESCPECVGGAGLPGDPIPHFEIPQPMFNSIRMIIDYVGTTDMSEPYIVYDNIEKMNVHKYRRSRNRKPYVFLNPAPNQNGMIDGYIFGAPYVQEITVVGVFKDLRKFYEDSCCEFDDHSDLLNAEIREKILAQYATFYNKILAEPKNQPII